MPHPKLTRRRLLQGFSTAALTIVLPRTKASAAASRQLNIACVGVGGKGASDMQETSVGHNIVAICDVDETRLSEASRRFPKAKTFTDWRRLLDHPGIDAVTVSTPDHMHAPVTMSAMQRGKHVFTQKPLAHSVYEARRLAEVAEEKGLVTQMGIQHHASARLKMAVQAIDDGVIGTVREVHAWTDRPGTYWRQGMQRPQQTDPVPEHLHWDHWLGVAPSRPYVDGIYHPFHWRGWWDFGTGALGDMGCHLLDPVVNALDLGPPSSIAAQGPLPNPESGPEWCVVDYVFPGTDRTSDTVHVTWYEAGRQPPPEVMMAPDDWKGSANGVLFVGQRGNLFVGFPEMPELFPKGNFTGYRFPECEDHNHYTQWTAAIADGGATSCPFSYSGPLAETVLLGNVAYRCGAKIEWDSRQLKAVGSPHAPSLLRRRYRDGWSIDSLT